MKETLLSKWNNATKTGLKNATGVGTFKLAAKSDLASLKPEVDKIVVNKLTTLATKAELKAEQNKITKLQTFDSSYFRGNSHF